ncbi:MAG: hypothetical protein HUU06_13090, partial [Planctomycetaceae bacterium]|nr:hypothetical protein [Planctomycetaceae bacterium]
MNGRRGLPVAWILVFLLGLGSGSVLVVSLGRRIAREREVTERSETRRREAVSALASESHGLREARERVALLEEERTARARVVEGETAVLRR